MKITKITQDSEISFGHILMELLKILRPDCFKRIKFCKLPHFSLFPERLLSRSEKLEITSYALTVARQQGAMVYALPENIVDVNEDIIHTLFASLMMLLPIHSPAVAHS